ncbi:MAG: hypothetical protein ACRYGR_06270 [Janthinobacterium lividum]
MTKTIVRKYVLTLSLSILMGLTTANLCSASGIDPFFPNTEDLLKATKQPIPKKIDEFSPNTYDLLQEEERQQKYSLKKVSEETKIKNMPWRTFGIFSETKNHGNSPLNRQFCVKPYHYTSNIEKISICGYKDDNIIIYVHMKKKDPLLYERLLKKNLLEDEFPRFKDFLESRNTLELDKFLNAFVEEGLIPYSVRSQILEEIKFNNPKPLN